MNPQQSTVSTLPSQVKSSKIKLTLLLISTILLILALVLVPVAAVLNSNNFLTNDPGVNSLVENIYLVFALAVLTQGVVGLITAWPYRKATKFHRSAVYLYGITALSIPFNWIINALYAPHFSRLWTTEIKFGEPTEIPLAVTILSPLIQYTALGIFCLSVACIIVSTRLIIKK